MSGEIVYEDKNIRIFLDRFSVGDRIFEYQSLDSVWIEYEIKGFTEAGKSWGLGFCFLIACIVFPICCFDSVGFSALLEWAFIITMFLFSIYCIWQFFSLDGPYRLMLRDGLAGSRDSFQILESYDKKELKKLKKLICVQQKHWKSSERI